MEIDGKRFLVAGSGEIGSRIARALAERGARVVATAREPEGRPELAAAHRAMLAGITEARLRRLRRADLVRALTWTAHGVVVLALLANGL